jgi:hypothetical protein
MAAWLCGKMMLISSLMVVMLCGAELPTAPSHDPQMPSAPKFSHTGVLYDETSVDEPGKSEDVQDDLMERFRKLNR